MPSISLQHGPLGPLIDVHIGVSFARRAALQGAGQPVPAQIAARMLIDTGASSTCVDTAIIATLGLVQTGVVPTHTPTTGNVPVDMPLYDAAITIPHPQLHRMFHAIAVSGCNLAAQGIQGLIGRDMLAACILVYNGEAGHFSLSF